MLWAVMGESERERMCQLPNSQSCCCTVMMLLVLGFLWLGVHAQTGFISIDCGSSTSYTDNNTNILWSTDEDYATSGSNGQSPSSVQSNVENAQQLQTVRYFPQEKSRYCYVLYPVIKNSTYLIRATFLYPTSLFGTLSQQYTFKLAVDATIWTTVTVDATLNTTAIYPESVYWAVSDQISVCIFPDGVGTPFISALELRPLSYGMYPTARLGSILKLQYRLNCGAALGTPNVRYPDDIYDRIWLATDVDITSNRTDASVPADPEVFDKPPEKVMQSAWVGENFEFNISFTENTSYLYIAFYFYDFFPRPNPSAVGGVRIGLNGIELIDTNITSHTVVEFVSTNKLDIDGYANFVFFKSSGATVGPYLNGAELYVNNDIQTTTSAADVERLYGIQNVLNLEEWAGDPCNPIPWDWVTCSSSFEPLRIVQIKLSNYSTGGYIPNDIVFLDQLTDLWLDGNNLTGSILTGLSDLANLQTLYLQNNELGGTIPTTLSQISGLRQLNVANNNLSGTVPADLQNDKRLAFTFTGNPFLCSNDSNCKVPSSPSTSSNAGAVAGGIGGGVAVVVIVVVLLCL